jgi:diacylglycerol O-acyltransferase
MRQLTGLDATFLNMETGRFTGHVGGLVLLDPTDTPSGTVTAEDIRRSIEMRMHLLEPFRWRLVEVPFDLDYPYWVEAEDFDLEFHVRELALPAPGTREQLAEQVARITARPLDRSRPLWEFYVIQGLEDGLVGLQTKIHHAAVDGASGSEILSVLFDVQPQPDIPPPTEQRKPERVPGELELVSRALTRLATQPLQAALSLGRLSTGLAKAGRSAASSRDGGILGSPDVKAPRLSFNAKVTPHRRFAFASVDLEQVKRIKRAFGATVNDVVLAMCAGGLRRWLLEHGELPDQPLVAAVPISVRTQKERGTYGNKVSAMMTPLPTNESHPRLRMELVAESMKARAARVGTTLMSRTAGSGPVPFNLIISNVPGPQQPLYVAGARVVAHHIVSGIGDGMGLNISLLGLDGDLDFGLVADRDLVPDLWTLMDYIQEEADVLLEVAEQPSRSKRAHPAPKSAR